VTIALVRGILPVDTLRAAGGTLDGESVSFSEAFAKLQTKLQGWLEGVVLIAPNAIAAILVVVLFWLFAKAARRLVSSFVTRLRASVQIKDLFATLAYMLVLALGVFVALGIVGLDKTVTSLLAGAGIVGLAFAFAFQDIAANFISGIVISVRHPFRIADIIETNDFLGTVRAINLRSTELMTSQGQIVLIPNKLIFENPIINYSRSGERRVDVAIGVSYADDLAVAKKAAVKAIAAMRDRLTGREVELYYEKFGETSVDLVLRFWIRFQKQSDFLAAQSEAIERIKAAFEEAGVTMPFPIRTIELGATRIAADAEGRRPDPPARVRSGH
jgi:small conductance mechanosensitive channel